MTLLLGDILTWGQSLSHPTELLPQCRSTPARKPESALLWRLLVEWLTLSRWSCHRPDQWLVLIQSTLKSSSFAVPFNPKVSPMRSPWLQCVAVVFPVTLTHTAGVHRPAGATSFCSIATHSVLFLRRVKSKRFKTELVCFARLCGDWTSFGHNTVKSANSLCG